MDSHRAQRFERYLSKIPMGRLWHRLAGLRPLRNRTLLYWRIYRSRAQCLDTLRRLDRLRPGSAAGTDLWPNPRHTARLAPDRLFLWRHWRLAAHLCAETDSHALQSFTMNLPKRISRRKFFAIISTAGLAGAAY